MNEILQPESIEMPADRGTYDLEKQVPDLLSRRAITNQKPFLDQELVTLPQTFPMRAIRAQMLEEALFIRHGQHKVTHLPKHQERFLQFRKNEREFLEATALIIKTREWEVTSTYTILNKDKLTTPCRPIVLISGAGNGLQSIDSLALEMAAGYPHQPILVLAQPEAPTNGGVDFGFLKAVNKDKEGVTPHAQVVEAVITYALAPWEEVNQNQEFPIDIIGFSLGGMTATELVTRPKWQQKIGTMILLAPGGCVSQTVNEFMKGFSLENDALKELLRLGYIHQEETGSVHKLTDRLRYALFNDTHVDKQKVLRFLTWLTLGKRAASNLILNLLLKADNQDHHVAVISGEKDEITKSASIFTEASQIKWGMNGKLIKTRVLPGETHNGPLYHAALWVNEIQKILTPHQANSNI